MEVKKIIKTLREKNQLTQEQMAERLMVSRQAISRWENGDTQPDTESLKLLSKEFNVSINTLLGTPRKLICQCCGMPLNEDDLNTRLSGLAAAILLEQGIMESEELGREVERRLSRGIPAELGAGWFAGLASRNHYTLIARLTLWENLSAYLDSLEEEEFKRALVFLRRAFADFSSMEKDQIAENLGEIWQVNPGQVSEALNDTLTEDAMEIIEGLEDFDFGDI